MVTYPSLDAFNADAGIMGLQHCRRLHCLTYTRVCVLSEMAFHIEMQEVVQIDGQPLSSTSNVSDGRHFVRYVGGPHQDDTYDGSMI